MYISIIISMQKIDCVDVFGNKYEFDENEFVDRKSVYGVCIVNNRILLTKDKWAGKWGIPGGGVDINESDYEALSREFIEETGITIAKNIQKLISDVTHFKPEGEVKPWKNMRTIYKVTAIGGDLKVDGNEDEVLEAKFLPVTEAITHFKQSQNNKILVSLVNIYG